MTPYVKPTVCDIEDDLGLVETYANGVIMGLITGIGALVTLIVVTPGAS